MLGANLKYLRLKFGYSQAYIAQYLNKKSFTTVQKWESGAADPPLGVVGKLAELYKVSIDDLYYSDLLHPKVISSDIVLSDSEKEMIKKYRQLPPAGKAAVDAVLDSQYEFVKPKLSEKIEIS
mgnify:CR=1 FL=1